MGALVGLAAVACVSACSVEAPKADGANDAAVQDEVVASEGGLAASCANPDKYFVTFSDGAGACAPVTGIRGRWLPELLFADAPPEVQAMTCAFRWSGERNAPPDRESLVIAVGPQRSLAPACGESSDVLDGVLEPIPFIDDPTHAGAAGCDVCGRLRERKAWVVLPPDLVQHQQVEVRLSNAEMRAFQIARTGARALRVELPPPPDGTSYVPGTLQLR